MNTSPQIAPQGISAYRRGVGLNVLAGLSVVGDVAAITALALWSTKNHSPTFLTGLLLADAVPGVLLGYVGGKLLDSLNTPRFWIAGLATQAALYLFLAFNLTTTTAIVVTALSSIISVLYGAAAFVHGQRLVESPPRDDTDTPGSPPRSETSETTDHPDKTAGTKLAKNHSVLTTAGSFIGLALTGWIYTTWGIQTCLVINAITFSTTMIIVPAILGARRQKAAPDNTKNRSPEPKKRPQQNVLITAFGASGLAVVFATVLATSIDSVSEYFVVLQVMKLSEAEFTTASALWGLCVVAGAAALKSRPSGSQQQGTTTMAQSSALMGVSLLGVAVFLPNFIGLLALYVLGGFANGAFNTAMSVRVSEGIPVSHQGRAWGTIRTLINAALISGMIISGIATAWSSRATVAAAGILPILIWLTYSIWRSASKPSHDTKTMAPQRPDHTNPND